MDGWTDGRIGWELHTILPTAAAAGVIPVNDGGDLFGIMID